jgi:hypothetical protein
MNTKPGSILLITIYLLFAGINSYGQDSTKAAKPVAKKPAVVKYIPPPIRPTVQVPAQQQPGANQPLPQPTTPAVVDHSLEGQYNDILSHTYSYHVPPLVAYHKSIMDSLNTEKRKFRDAQQRLIAQAKVIADLQGSVNGKDQSLTESANKQNQISFVGIPLSKGTFTLVMWALVIVLGGALAIVVYTSGSNRSEAAYRIKLYEELEDEFKAYKAKANDKEKKLARELQTERNKVDELMGKK